MKAKNVARTALELLAMGAGAVVCTMCGKDTVNPEEAGQGPLPPSRADTLYVTGVEYPAGYDWVKDQEYGTVSCRIFLEKEGRRIVEVPVGYSYEAASDPDMHRCVKGHLYTDYSSDTETVIKKDGAVLFRYPGREMISDFLVSEDNDVYTLGQPRSGSGGFAFRKNGQALVEEVSGNAVSGIKEEDGHIYLLYKTVDGEGRKGYCLYDNGGLTPISGVSANEDILHAVISGGKPVYAVSQAGSSTPLSGYIFRDGNRYAIETGDYGIPVYCRILDGGSGLFLSGVCRDIVSGEHTYAVWNAEGKLMYSFSPGSVPYYSFADGGNVYDFFASESIFDEMSCYRNGQLLYSYGRNQTVYGNSPAAVCRGGLYFIFSDRTGQRVPYMAAENKIKSYGFNGFFSGVSAW